MHQTKSVVYTKLAPPRPQKFTLHRPRVTQRLLDARQHRLTILQAGTGYGKSTALAALANEPTAFIWYRLDPEDIDPQRFLAHLLHGFASILPQLSDAPLALFEEWSSNRTAVSWTVIIDTLINELSGKIDPDKALFLTLDDTHFLNKATEPSLILDRLIGLAPPNLHIILATRYPLALPTLINWRVKGQLLEIGQDELAFTPDEIDALFRNNYSHPLTEEQATFLVEQVEGWPIALFLVWQNLQQEGGATLAEAIDQLSGSAGDLFRYLTQEILSQQPPDIQSFLEITAVLRQMTASSCDFLRSVGNKVVSDSDQILQYLLNSGLFVVALDEEQIRYHHLFRELLLQQTSPAEQQANHRRAAAWFEKQKGEEEAIYHWLAANAFEDAAKLLTRYRREMIRVGRLDTLAGWIGTLPPAILSNFPTLLTSLGDIARLHSQFDQALGWYEQAAKRSRTLGDFSALGQALRGQARVYLDTVNPSQAEQLLQEALRLIDGHDDRESRARLNELMAENLLNQGRMMEAAKQYQSQARELRQEGPSQVELPVRVLLRTGRMGETRQLLEKQAAAERQEPVLHPRAHRETLLLLSLVLSFQGEQARAFETAVSGTDRGIALHSDFVTAVGYMRQGHAWTVQKSENGYRKAAECHQKAIQFSEKLDVPRLKVEAYWGLCQAHGFRGELETAVRIANQGIDIAQTAGDEWIEALIRVTMGASYIVASKYKEAIPWLAQAVAAFRSCGDTHGETISHLWQSIIWYHTSDTPRLDRDLSNLLQLSQTHGYDYLFLQKTLLGPPDPRLLVPLLLTARTNKLHGEYVQRLLTQLGLENLQEHPGYQLRVQTLGDFRIWRGIHEVPHKAWRRKKARHLFLLLLTHRGHLLHRDQLCDLLWPELTNVEAQRHFKIAYSAMSKALEPNRKRNAPSAFVVRKDSRYGLRPEADVWIDVDVLKQLIVDAEGSDGVETAVSLYQRALALYNGDYLQAYPYEEWCSEERERLSIQFLQSAERLATMLIQQEAWAEAIQVSQRILQQDDCWENAYRILMQAYAAQGERTQAIRTYQRCVERLHSELGVAPSPLTIQIFENMTES